MKKIVIATKNQGKLREMRQAFAHLPVEVVALDAFAEIPEPVEDGHVPSSPLDLLLAGRGECYVSDPVIHLY